MPQIQRFDLLKKPSFGSIDKALKQDGVVVVENFLDFSSCDNIASILEGEQKHNSNELSFIHINDAKFFSNALGVSKEAYDLVTKREVFKISKKYLGESIRLKCHRAYSNKKLYYFPWHTDNKFGTKKNEEHGIVFIVYLVDTNEGATEFVMGSHNYSHDFEANNFGHSYIGKKFKSQIEKANGKKGSVVISDTRTIHRGGVGSGQTVNRKSFWFQVESNMDSAERLLLNPEFLPEKVDSSLARYLGFSRVSGLDVHPVTTDIGRVLPFNYRIKMFVKFGLLVAQIPLHWLRLKLGENMKVKLRNLFRLKSDWN